MAGFGAITTIRKRDRDDEDGGGGGSPDRKAARVVGPARPSAAETAHWSKEADDSSFLQLLQRGTSERPRAKPAPEPRKLVELNPYWDNGTGMPAEDDKSESEPEPEAEPAASGAASGRRHQDFSYMDKYAAEPAAGAAAGAGAKGGDKKKQKQKQKPVVFADEASNYKVSDLARDKKEEASKGKLIDYKRMNASRLKGDCMHCMDGRLDRQHVIALGNRVYLALPAKGSLCAGHCLIVPLDHKISARDFSSDEQAEIRNFKKCLAQMFYERKQRPVFLETVLRMQQFRHTFIECYPLSEEEYADASIAFYKEMDDAESEFRQTNKRVIKFKDKEFHTAIPADFPYFAVEFGLEGGMVHLIAEERKWNPHFGRDVVGGLLGLATGGRTRSAGARGTSKEEFVAMWKPYDWTVALEDEG